MRTFTLLILSALFLVSSACAFEGDEELDLDSVEQEAGVTDSRYQNLAYHWAPLFYAKTNSDSYKTDYITKFNYDGDWDGLNNWESLAPLTTVPAYVYYSVVETTTHYFIGYYLFHPRDTCDEFVAWCNRHENDVEGVILAIRKDGSLGELVAAVSNSHGDLKRYTVEPGILSGSESIDGTLPTYGDTARFLVDAKGHAIHACGSDCGSSYGGTGIIYTAGSSAQSPTTGAGKWTSVYTYRLIALDDTSEGMWTKRNELGPGKPYHVWGNIRGNTYNDNAANMPWVWDDGDDGEIFVGANLCDPAQFFDTSFNGTPFNNFSHDYVYNPYATHRLDIYQVRSDRNRDTWGNGSDLYIKATAATTNGSTTTLIDQHTFKQNNASVGRWYNWRRGGGSAEGERSYGDNVQSHYFCRSGNPTVYVMAWDSDWDSSPDFMGSVGCTGSCDYSSGIDLGDARVKFRVVKYNYILPIGGYRLP